MKYYMPEVIAITEEIKNVGSITIELNIKNSSISVDNLLKLKAAGLIRTEDDIR